MKLIILSLMVLTLMKSGNMTIITDSNGRSSTCIDLGGGMTTCS